MDDDVDEEEDDYAEVEDEATMKLNLAPHFHKTSIKVQTRNIAEL